MHFLIFQMSSKTYIIAGPPGGGVYPPPLHPGAEGADGGAVALKGLGGAGGGGGEGGDCDGEQTGCLKKWGCPEIHLF